MIDINHLSDKVKLILDKDKLVFNLTSSILIDKLKDELKETTSLVKIKQIKNRLAKLTNGFVSIYVGGNTLEEQQYKLLKYEDTIKTGYNALTEGIVIGGGYIYYKLANKLDNIYINILKEALYEFPIEQININFPKWIDGLDISHVGFATFVDGKIHLLHASSAKKEVIIDPLSLTDYLAKFKHHVGIKILRGL